MSEADKAEAKANQDTFFGVISNWKSANSGKQLVFQGYPANLIGQSVLSSCDHIILITNDATDVAQLGIEALQALMADGVRLTASLYRHLPSLWIQQIRLPDITML